jgi:hypothetical protein
MDDGNGLVHARARYYAPALGRFISEDPIRSGLNYYTWADNRPTNLIDPLGLYNVKDDDAFFRTDQGFSADHGDVTLAIELFGDGIRATWPGDLAGRVRALDRLSNSAVNCVVGVRTASCGGFWPDSLRDFGPAERHIPSDACDQDKACERHDKAIRASGHHFLEIWNPAVAKAHGNLSRGSPNSPGMRGLFWALAYFERNPLPVPDQPSTAKALPSPKRERPRGELNIWLPPHRK